MIVNTDYTKVNYFNLTFTDYMKKWTWLQYFKRAYELNSIELNFIY